MNAPLRPLTDETVRRATAEDVPRLARLFAAVFATDPVFKLADAGRPFAS